MTGIISDNVGRPSGLIKAASGGGGGVWTLIKTLTASADGTLSFVNGTDDVVLDSTYPIYRFSVINIHPSASSQGGFQFNGRDGSTAYDATKTTTLFRAYHFEDDSGSGLGYRTGSDLAQSTGFQRLTDDDDVGVANDSGASGELLLFSPSSTTFAKHFISNFNNVQSDSFSINSHMAGYFNVTAAIDAIQFKFGSGNIDLGKIKLYGLKDSA
jgi:hypothetical protein